VISDGIIRSNVIASQQVHARYGGVVPELASRQHLQHIVEVVQEAIHTSGIEMNQLNALAFTAGPGLIGSLLVGSSFAKALAVSLDVPVISVHHMQAHVHAHFLSRTKPEFPFLCLTVSGGHTQIVLVKDFLNMEIVGETLDDAAGEAFDKTAKLLKLPYPGGPLIDRYAQQGRPKFIFPEPDIPGLDFSFSGLKTSVLYFLRENTAKNPRFAEENMNDICASVQERIVSILLNKLELATEQFQIIDVAIAGGVSANSALRSELISRGERNGWRVFIPPLEYCTDNAAMIASVAYHKYLAGEFDSLNVAPAARMGWGS
jgi:N6-L-threonylcarbamoyladenine synthase